MNYRICTKKDIPVMCEMRKQQLIQSGIDPKTDIDADLYRFFSDKLDDGSLVEWMLEENGEVVATAGILFIEFPAYLRKCEFDNSQGLLSGYLYELFKEKILHINSKFRKWRKETNNEDNAKINVSYLHIILIYLNRRIFGNIIYLRILLY